MGLLKFVALVAFFMFNVNYAMGEPEKFYDKLREQAAVCVKGQTYNVEADGCSNTCECVTTGVLRCDENECSGEGAEGNDGSNDNNGGSLFEKLRDDATSCTEGEEKDVKDCGKCTCVIAGILNCRFKTGCLPNHSRHRRNDVSNLIIG